MISCLRLYLAFTLLLLAQGGLSDVLIAISQLLQQQQQQQQQMPAMVVSFDEAKSGIAP